MLALSAARADFMPSVSDDPAWGEKTDCTHDAFVAQSLAGMALRFGINF